MKYLNKRNILKLKNLQKRYTMEELFYKVLEKVQTPYKNYTSQYHQLIPTTKELENQRKENFKYRPLISIVVPTYETEEVFLRQMLDSVLAQTYYNWELCIADGSESEKVWKVISREYFFDMRIRYEKLEENGGISKNTNQGIRMAEGEYIAFLDHDDLLAPWALYEVVKSIQDTQADVIYSNEDKVTSDLGEYLDPHIKLKFNQELLMGNNYICHFLVVSKNLIEQVGCLDGNYDGAQDYEFILRCSAFTEKIHHVEKVLYHWRIHPLSTAGNTDSKLYAYEAGKRAIESHLQRLGWSGSVSMTKDLGFYTTRYRVPKNLTLGIYFWGKTPVLVGKIRKQLENEFSEKNIKVIWNYDFTEPVDYIVMVYRDIVALSTQGISLLLGSCARKGVAMAGGRTIRRNKVQQCGYWREEDQYLARYQNLPARYKGYYHRAFLPVEVDAVGREIVVVDYQAFQQAGGNRKYLESWKGWQKLSQNLQGMGQRIITMPQVTAKLKESTLPLMSWRREHV